MPDFKAKMHQIRFRLGLRPKTPLGELTAEGRGGEEGRGRSSPNVRDALTPLVKA